MLELINHANPLGTILLDKFVSAAAIVLIVLSITAFLLLASQQIRLFISRRSKSEKAQELLNNLKQSATTG